MRVNEDYKFHSSRVLFAALKLGIWQLVFHLLFPHDFTLVFLALICFCLVFVSTHIRSLQSNRD